MARGFNGPPKLKKDVMTEAVSKAVADFPRNEAVSAPVQKEISMEQNADVDISGLTAPQFNNGIGVQLETPTEPAPVANESGKSTLEDNLSRELEKNARGSKLDDVYGAVRSLVQAFHDSTNDSSKVDALIPFVRHKEEIIKALSTGLLSRSGFDDLVRFAEAYAPEIAERNVDHAQTAPVEQVVAEPVAPTPEDKIETEASATAEVAQEPALNADAKEVTPAEKEQATISLTEVQGIISEKLSGKAKINALEITNTLDGLQLHAELDAGLAGGKISLNGKIVNSGNTIAVDGLDIKARGYVKSMIDSNISGLNDAIKSHFEKQYGKPISSIQVGPSGLVVEFEAPAEVDINTRLDGRIDPTLVGKPEQTEEISPVPDGTQDWRDRWRGKLREAIDGAKEKFGEKTERAKNYLTERANVLHEKAKESGSDHEKFVRDIGEKYNKLPILYKFGIGVTLGIGTAVASGVSLPLTMLGGGLIAGQRAFGMAGMFMRLEEHLQSTAKGTSQNFLGKRKWYKNFIAGRSEQSRKNIASTISMIWSYGMGAGIAEGVREFNQSDWGRQLHEWLRDDTPSAKVAKGSAEATAPPQSAPEAPPTPKPDAEVPQPEKVPPPAPKPEAPPEPAPEVQTAPKSEAATAESGVAEPDAKVEAEAEPEPEIKFEMPKHADFSIHEDDTTISPYDVTPVEDVQTDDVLSVTEAESGTETENIEEQNTPAESSTWTTRGMNIQSESPTETNVLSTEQEEIIIKQPTESPMVDLTQETVSAEGTFAQPEIITNQSGLKIQVKESHLYNGVETGNKYVFGGTHAERIKAMLQYLIKNKNEIIIGTDPSGRYRVPWRFVQGNVTPAGMPMRTSGLFGSGFLSSFMKPPGPEDLRSFIK